MTRLNENFKPDLQASCNYFSIRLYDGFAGLMQRQPCRP